jgi:hypothetical protein
MVVEIPLEAEFMSVPTSKWKVLEAIVLCFFLALKPHRFDLFM